MNENEPNQNINANEMNTNQPQADQKSHAENTIIIMAQKITGSLSQAPDRTQDAKETENENNPTSDATDDISKDKEIENENKDPDMKQVETIISIFENQDKQHEEEIKKEEATDASQNNDNDQTNLDYLISQVSSLVNIATSNDNTTNDPNDLSTDNPTKDSNDNINNSTSNDQNDKPLDDAANESTLTNISDDIPPPRVVPRRQFEKSDAAVQIENDDDSVFQTAVDSPVNLENGEERRTAKSRKRPHRYYDVDDNEDSFIPEPPRQFSDEELEAALKRQIKTKKLPPLEMREELINYARNQSLFKLMEEDYDTASKIDDAIEMNIQSLQQNEVKADINHQTLTLQEHLEEAVQQKTVIEERHKQRIEEFKKLEQQRLDDLRAQHENERKLFEEEWTREETLLKFNKPSQKLFQIRRQQKAMAISHDFENARYLKKMGDQLQKQESDRASQRAADSMRNKYLGLLAKQQKEEECLIEYGIRRLGQLQIEREAELHANEVHRNALEVKIKTPKFVKKPKVQIPRTSYGSRSRGANSQSVTGVISNRARSQFATFKKADDKTRLEIKLGDVRRITKPLTPVSRKNDSFPFTF